MGINKLISDAAFGIIYYISLIIGSDEMNYNIMDKEMLKLLCAKPVGMTLAATCTEGNI